MTIAISVARGSICSGVCFLVMKMISLKPAFVSNLLKEWTSNYLKNLVELKILHSEEKGKELIFINTQLYQLLQKG